MSNSSNQTVSSGAIRRPGEAPRSSNAWPAWDAGSGMVGSLAAIWVLMTLIASNPALAQGPDPGAPTTASVGGSVTTAGPQGPEAVPGITVELKNSAGEHELSASTDAEGHYQFSKATPGEYTLAVAAQGFSPFAETIALKPEENRTEGISLELARFVQKVEVHDKPADVATDGADTTSTISARQFTVLPLAEQKFKSALPLVPSVVRTGDGKLNFKGAPENQGMLLVDSVQSVDPVTGSFSIPIPLDAVQTVKVDDEPYNAQYGGFSGGLATIETKPPTSDWHWGVMDFVPGFRGKSGHIVGLSDATPRLFFGGPLIKNKLNFSEDATYDVQKVPVRGLAWPNNEIKRQGFDTLTTFQAVPSPQHLLSVNVNAFSHRDQFADINALVPQTASSDDGQRGSSIGANDTYQFASGALFSTVLRYTAFDSNSHGQGPEDMLISPEGWGGNFFDTWARSARQFELLPIYQFPLKDWLGRHQVRIGIDLSHRSYAGTDQSRPVQLTRQDGSLAEQISFMGGGLLEAQDTEVAGFVQDDWRVNERLGLNLGGRFSTQSIGRSAAFSPRGGFVYAPGEDRKTVIRGGGGLFYDRVPLMAADFLDNPTRVVSLYDPAGALLGEPVTYQNAYLTAVPGRGYVATTQNPDSSPRNFTANIEIERELRRHLVARVKYLYSQTQDLYVVDPLTAAAGGSAWLGLASNGGSHYHQLEASVHYQAGERSELNAAYVHSGVRGDLNALSDVYVPFEGPVIRPDVTSSLASNVPDRFVSWGAFGLPWRMTLSPVVDVHSGLPYSNVDAFQNYVGGANTQHLPAFCSLDVKIYRDFKVNLPGVKNRKLRLGLYSLNLTNHSNWLEAYNNVASPYFGHFVGMQHRVDGFVIDIVK
jgi:Carboxypeptidase regulatory-like domain/TonB dependent receptor